MTKNITIASDDPLALCTKEGWAAEQERIKIGRSGAYGKEGPAVPNARFWMASTKPTEIGGEARVLFIECERWVDARAAAVILLAGDVVVAGLPREHMRAAPHPRVQIRWTGAVARDRRVQVRNVGADDKPLSEWRDLR